jgi:hypothetical protein
VRRRPLTCLMGNDESLTFKIKCAIIFHEDGMMFFLFFFVYLHYSLSDEHETSP